MRRLESVEFALHQLEQAITTIMALGTCVGDSHSTLEQLREMEARARDADGFDDNTVGDAIALLAKAFQDQIDSLKSGER